MGEKRKEQNIKQNTQLHLTSKGPFTRWFERGLRSWKKKKVTKLSLYLYGNIMNVKIQHLVCREWKDARKLHMQ